MSAMPLFSPRALTGWIAAAVGIFAISLVLAVRGGPATAVDAAGANSFSRSALGYAGIVELLQRLGVPAEKSRGGSLAKLRPGDLLVLAEPEPGTPGFEQFPPLLNAANVLLILPKWQGSESKTHVGSIDDVLPVGPLIAGGILGFATRPGAVETKSDIGAWTANRIGRLPEPQGDIQLIQDATGLSPIVAAEKGLLLGEIRQGARRKWVLSDPGVIDNHGIANSANAAFAVALIEAMRGPGENQGGKVIFDETIHGFTDLPPNPFALPFRYPFVISTLLAFLATAALLWGTMRRFGAAESEAASITQGKEALLHSAARLLDYAGHHRSIVRRYVSAMIAETGRDLRAPAALSEEALVDWLDKVAENRGLPPRCATLQQRAILLSEKAGRNPTALLPLVRDIHQWRQEITHGPAHYPRRR